MMARNSILLSLAALTVAAPLVAATHDLVHPPTCQLFPTVAADGTFAWVLEDDYAADQHGGTRTVSVSRSLGEAATTASLELVPTDVKKPLDVYADGHSKWGLVAAARMAWTPSLDLPFGDVGVVITADILLHGRTVASQTREFLLTSPTQSRFLPFDFTPTLDYAKTDAIGTRVAVTLDADDPIEEPGTLTVDFLLHPPRHDQPIGEMSQLLVPAECYDAKTQHQPSHGNHGEGGGNHTYGSGHGSASCHDCGDGEPSPSGTGTKGVARPQPVPASAVPATTDADWTPAAVTAMAGLAGLSLFRPRRP